MIHHQIHDVALALGADQFHGQQTANGLGGRNHLRARQATGGDHPLEIDPIQLSIFRDDQFSEVNLQKKP